MTNRSLVSVVIPTFNTPTKFLVQAIGSALDQTYADIDVVVIDDCSDLPFSGVDKIITSERVTWIKSETNGGVGAARNRGVEQAGGNWVAFLDADDWWDPNKISKQISILESKPCKWSYVGANITDETGTVLRHVSARVSGDILADCLRELPISGSCSSVVIDRQLFIDLGGFDANHLVEEDWDMWIRCAQGHPVASVSENLTYIRQHCGSRSGDPEKQINRVRRLFEKHAALYADNNLTRFQKSHIDYITARHLIRVKKYGPALFLLIKSLIIEPRKAMVLLSYLAGHFGR